MAIYTQKDYLKILHAYVKEHKTQVQIYTEMEIPHSVVWYVLSEIRAGRTPVVLENARTDWHSLVIAEDKNRKQKTKNNAPIKGEVNKVAHATRKRANSWQYTHLEALKAYMSHPEWTTEEIEQKFGICYNGLSPIVRKCALYYAAGNKLPGLDVFIMRSQDARDKRNFEFAIANKHRTSKDVERIYKRKDLQDENFLKRLTNAVKYIFKF